MNKDERAELRRLAEAAAPGPWATCTVSRAGGTFAASGPGHDPDSGGAWVDAAFIAAARNALPALLDYVDALEAVVAAYRRARGWMASPYNAVCSDCTPTGDQYTDYKHEDGCAAFEDCRAIEKALAALDEKGET